MRLLPAPDEVVGAVLMVIESGWPPAGQDGPFLAALGIAELHDVDEQDPAHRVVAIATSGWGEASGELSGWRGELFWLGWFLHGRVGSTDRGQERQGFDTLSVQLHQALGTPSEQWGPPEEPACVWHHRGSSVELHCYQRLSSMVQLAISDQARSRDFEARTRGHARGDRREGSRLDG